MARFAGIIGFINTEESEPGIFEEVVVEKQYKGFIIQDSTKVDVNDRAIPNFEINNRFSIVADDFAYANFPHIRYLEFNGAKWSITNIRIQYPRLVISVGGVYNG